MREAHRLIQACRCLCLRRPVASCSHVLHVHEMEPLGAAPEVDAAGVRDARAEEIQGAQAREGRDRLQALVREQAAVHAQLLQAGQVRNRRQAQVPHACATQHNASGARSPPGPGPPRLRHAAQCIRCAIAARPRSPTPAPRRVRWRLTECSLRPSVLM